MLVSSGPMIGLSVLGPLRLTVGERSCSIRGALKNRLICRLALSPHETVSTDALIDALWGDDPPRTARQSVHVHVSHLRDRLRPDGADRIVATAPDGRYQLGIDREALDTWTFETRCSEGIGALNASNHRRARDLLSDAVALWGDPFQELADHASALAERHRLSALHETATDALGEAMIALGEIEDAVPLLRSVVATSPLRERPYALLMQAYSELAEPARVVEAYDLAARTFHEALGVEPTDELRSLAESARRPSARRRSTGSADQLDVDISSNLLLAVPPDADLRPLLDAISATADAHWREVAHGRLTPGVNLSPMSPVLELSATTAPRRLGEGNARRAFFTKVTHELVARFAAGPVVVIEGAEHAGELLVEYLTFALARPAPLPFTVILIDTGTFPDSPARAALGDLCRVGQVPPLPKIAPLAERLTRLDGDELLAVALLAVAGGAVPTDVLADATGLPTRRVSAAVDRLIARAHVVVAVAGQLELRTVTTPALVSEVLARPLVDLHLALADAFRHAGRGGATGDVAEARHRLAALPSGSAALAWQTAATAVRHLESLGAYREVLALTQSAVGADGPWPDDPNVLDVLLLVGRAHVRCGESLDGRKVLERVIASARAVGRADVFADAVRYLAEERAPQQSQDDVRRLVVEALDGLGPEPTDTRIQLMTDLANSRFFDDPVEAERLGRETVEVAHGGAPGTRARALTGYIQTLMRPGAAEERRQLAIEAQQDARRSGSTESLVLALTYEAMALVELGELRRAGAPMQYAAALATEVQVPRFQWWAATWRSLLEFVLGETADAEVGFRAAFDVWPTTARSDSFECYASQVTMLRLLEGRGAELLPVLESLVGSDADLGYLAPAALAFAQAGRTDEAVMTVDLVLDGIDDRRDIVRSFGLALTAEAAHSVGYESAGHRLARMIQPIAGSHVVLNVWGGGGFYWGSLEHANGLALDLAGRRDEARHALTRAVRHHDLAGVPRFLARSSAALDAVC